MSWEPHLITPFEKSGLNKYYKPWLIGEEAFPDIEDAYPWRGSVKKREGYRLLAAFPSSDKPVQTISKWINPSSLAEKLIAFSLTKSYAFTDPTGPFVNITQLSDTTAFSFGNGATNYFWTCNYANSMWATNGLGYTNAGVPGSVDGILYLTSSSVNSWNIQQAQINGTPTYLNGALIILPYKGRLVVLNTIEGGVDGSGNTQFQNRARWSQVGTPYVATNPVAHPPSAPSPFSQDDTAWRSDIPGKGGFTDADTSETIISAEIVKDTLIVFFQRSTWRLRYTGNEVLPFIWERLNTQYGAESTFSHVAFDDVALAFSRFGWIASDTNNVARIDLNIPDDSFSIESTNSSLSGLSHVQGIRDFYRNFAYWTFQTIGNTTPNKIYAYNYIDKTWAIFNPTASITTFGTYRTQNDVTWSILNNSSLDLWELYNDDDSEWRSLGVGEVINFPYILGGDTNGNVYQMFEFFNAPSTDNGTIFNFNIITKRLNPYISKGHRCRVGFVDLYVDSRAGGEILFQHYIDDQTASPVVSKIVQLSNRGAIAISSIVAGATTTINTVIPHTIVSGEIVNLSEIVGNIGAILNWTSPAQDFVATVTSATQFTLAVDTAGLSYVSGTGIVYSAQRPIGDSKYVRVYLNVAAYQHQFVIQLPPDVINDNDPVKGPAQLELQGIVLWTRDAGRIKG